MTKVFFAPPSEGDTAVEVSLRLPNRCVHYHSRFPFFFSNTQHTFATIPSVFSCIRINLVRS
jgi:hypothetical protein